MLNNRIKKITSCTFVLLVSLVFIQLLYMTIIILKTSTYPSTSELFDTVLVYDGAGDRRDLASFNLASRLHVRNLIISSFRPNDEIGYFKVKSTEIAINIMIEKNSLTTDQNARYSIPILKMQKAKSVVLLTSWYHMPRSYLLTRLYSIGSGIHWVCVSAEPLPKEWWKQKELLVELYKFWGSLGRVVLATTGIENWPVPPLFQDRGRDRLNSAISN